MKKPNSKRKDEKVKYTHFLKQRVLVLMIIATITVLLLFVSKYDVRLQIHDLLPHRNADYSEPFTDKEYFIRTPGCKMPGFEPFSNSVVQFYYAENPVECYNASNPPLIQADHHSIWIEERYFPNYKILPDSDFLCCYTPFYRQPSNESSSDDRSKFVEDCIKFTGQLNISDEFIRVSCYVNGTKIYTDLFSFVIKDSEHSNKNSNTNRPSVLVLGLDAVSRLNFFRTMPKTMEVLKSLDAIDMNGYNKVGDNTYPNLIPVLSGQSDKELESTCETKTSTFDKCHFVWDDFKSQGYSTAFVEDAAPIGLFNYHKSGFSDTPTDFYWRTFNRQAIMDIGHEKRMNCHLCLGPRLSVDVLLSYTKQLAVKLEPNPYFAFVWETSLTHDYLNYPLLADEHYANFITSLNNRGLLNSTILVLLSDHGIRWGKIRSTHQGQIEERLPFLFFVLPKSFKSKYKVATYNLRRNTKRLTTPFDLHETLLDMANIKTISNENIRTRTTSTPYMNKRGISLFLPIVGNRTCTSADVAPHWCTCHQSRDVETNTTNASLVAEVVVGHINTLLSEYVQCAKLNLSRIMSMSVGESTYTENLVDIDHIVTDYTIILETKPGNGMFEATVRNSISGWTVTGSVSRINLYGKQSYCVDDFHLKLYCYCEHFLPQFKFFK